MDEKEKKLLADFEKFFDRLAKSYEEYIKDTTDGRALDILRAKLSAYRYTLEQFRSLVKLLEKANQPEAESIQEYVDRKRTVEDVPATPE